VTKARACKGTGQELSPKVLESNFEIMNFAKNLCKLKYVVGKAMIQTVCWSFTWLVAFFNLI
jgi:hypothetical protein